MADLTVIEAEPPGEGVIEALEWALEKTRAGEISSVAIAIVNREGAISRRWSRLPSYPAMLGSLARLMYLIQREQDE